MTELLEFFRQWPMQAQLLVVWSLVAMVLIATVEWIWPPEPVEQARQKERLSRAPRRDARVVH